jgi:hypothetical protein
MNEQRSRLAVPLVLGLLGGSASLIGCQSGGQSRVDDGPSGSGLLPPPPAADGSRGDWITPPWAARSLPISRFRPAEDDFLPPLPAA